MQGGGKYTTIDSQQLQGSVPVLLFSSFFFPFFIFPSNFYPSHFTLSHFFQAVPDPPPVTVKFTGTNSSQLQLHSHSVN